MFKSPSAWLQFEFVPARVETYPNFYFMFLFLFFIVFYIRYFNPSLQNKPVELIILIAQ